MIIQPLNPSRFVVEQIVQVLVYLSVHAVPFSQVVWQA